MSTAVFVHLCGNSVQAVSKEISDTVKVLLFVGTNFHGFHKLHSIHWFLNSWFQTLQATIYGKIVFRWIFIFVVQVDNFRKMFCIETTQIVTTSCEPEAHLVINNIYNVHGTHVFLSFSIRVEEIRGEEVAVLEAKYRGQQIIEHRPLVFLTNKWLLLLYLTWEKSIQDSEALSLGVIYSFAPRHIIIITHINVCKFEFTNTHF